MERIDNAKHISWVHKSLSVSESEVLRSNVTPLTFQANKNAAGWRTDRRPAGGNFQNYRMQLTTQDRELLVRWNDLDHRMASSRSSGESLGGKGRRHGVVHC